MGDASCLFLSRRSKEKERGNSDHLWCLLCLCVEWKELIRRTLVTLAS